MGVVGRGSRTPRGFRGAGIGPDTHYRGDTLNPAEPWSQRSPNRWDQLHFSAVRGGGTLNIRGSALLAAFDHDGQHTSWSLEKGLEHAGASPYQTAHFEYPTGDLPPGSS